MIYRSNEGKKIIASACERENLPYPYPHTMQQICENVFAAVVALVTDPEAPSIYVEDVEDLFDTIFRNCRPPIRFEEWNEEEYLRVGDCPLYYTEKHVKLCVSILNHRFHMICGCYVELNRIGKAVGENLGLPKVELSEVYDD